MKRTSLWLLIAGALILLYFIYQHRHSTSGLDVEPHALEEIEKAKHQ